MESWPESLRGVLDVPGLRRAHLVEVPAGATVATHGAAGTAAGRSESDTDSHLADGADDADDGADRVAAVVAWASAELGRPDRRALRDAVITTGEAYHLVRPLIPDDGAADAPALLAYLRVDRVRGNLALARRALLALPSHPLRTATEPSVGPVIPAQRTGRPPAGVIGPGPAAGSPTGHAAPPIPLPRRGSGAGAGTPGTTAPTGRPPAALAPSAAPLTARVTDRVTAQDASAGAPGAPGGPAVPGPRPGPGPPGGGWADDLPTMARILAALRRPDRSSTTES